MPTLEQIKSQIKTLNSYERFLARKEIRELPAILWEDERVENIILGRYNNSIGILIATNKRVVFVDKGFFKLAVEDFEYSKISSILYSSGIYYGRLVIFSAGNKSIINDVQKGKLRVFADWIRTRISKPTENILHNHGQVLSRVEQLERLGKLKDQGILNELEFNNEKVKILGS